MNVHRVNDSTALEPALRDLIGFAQMALDNESDAGATRNDHGELWSHWQELSASMDRARAALELPKPDKLIKMVCGHCGSDNVTADALARWNVATQQWEHSSELDTRTCEECGEENWIVERPV